MGVPDSQLEELERQRRELEDNIWKLQESLYHWRTWEAEYDGLKDEINDLDKDEFFEHIVNNHPAPQAPRYIWKVQKAMDAM